jgi:ATP-dependent 26S proteasome regulatory subunit
MYCTDIGTLASKHGPLKRGQFHWQVIMCTNRADTLDPALLRPGRLDRKIEFPQPGRREKRLIFQASHPVCYCA